MRPFCTGSMAFAISTSLRAAASGSAHGMATTILEVEAYASLTQLLRLAQFCSDRWDELTV
jgi:hypothetical protein